MVDTTRAMEMPRRPGWAIRQRVFVPDDLVLIVASEDDVHARSVASVLQRDFGCRSVIWDIARFPTDDTISLSFAKHGLTRLNVKPRRSLTVSVSAIRSVWWRRPAKHDIDGAVVETDARAFCLRESDSCLKGALEAAGVHLVNDISRSIRQGSFFLSKSLLGNRSRARLPKVLVNPGVPAVHRSA